MKIAGKKIENKYVEEVYIPRGEEGAEGVLLKVQAVLDFAKFDELCPEPKPPMITRVGQGTIAKVDDPGYKADLEVYNRKRMAFFVIEGLRATEDIEWETLDVDNPATWDKYEDELKDAGLTQMEIGQVFQAVLRVNNLDEEHLKASRKRFLARMQEVESNPSIQKDVQPSTPSSEPASDSELNPTE